jgi:hypothetical protein
MTVGGHHGGESVFSSSSAPFNVKRLSSIEMANMVREIMAESSFTGISAMASGIAAVPESFRGSCRQCAYAIGRR